MQQCPNVSAIGDVEMMSLVREEFPFYLMALGVLLLATLYPPIATWMPSLIN
jgi:TRAP-type C4-dicarboxylate transport system permease large subunit